MNIDQIRYSPSEQDTPLVAASFTTDTLPDLVVVRLVPQALADAEAAMLEAFQLHPQTLQPVGFVRPRAIGFPAWPILQNPADAPRTLKLVKEIDRIRRQAKSHPSATLQYFRSTRDELLESAPQFVPTFLEEGARIFKAVGNDRMAKQCFSAAREAERAFNIPIDDHRHRGAFQEFAALGVIGTKEFTAESRDAAARMPAKAAYEYFADLILDRASKGFEIFAANIQDLVRLGRNAGHKPQEVQIAFLSRYVHTRGFVNTKHAQLQKLLPILATAARRDPKVGMAVATTPPLAWNLTEYIDALKQIGQWEVLLTDPEALADWIMNLFATRNTTSLLSTNSSDLLQALDLAQDHLSGSVTIRSGRNCQIALDYLDALLACGVQITAEQSTSWPRPKVSLEQWVTDGERDLSYALRDATVRPLIFAACPTTNMLNWALDKLLASTLTTQFVAEWLTNFAIKVEQARGSEKKSSSIYADAKYLTDPRLLAVNPEAMAQILHFDYAEELALRLQRGTLAEYTWPLFEKITADTSSASSQLQSTNQVLYSFPHVGVYKKEILHVLDGDKEIVVPIPSNVTVMDFFVLDDEVLVLFTSGSQHYFLWSNEGVAHPIAGDRYFKRNCSFSRTVEGALQIGAHRVQPGQHLAALPEGTVQGTGPLYVGPVHKDKVSCLGTDEILTKHKYKNAIVSNTLPGMDTSQLDFSSLPPDATTNITDNYFVPATPTTCESPLGTIAGNLVGFRFQSGEGSTNVTTWISPLGSFTKKLTNLRVLTRPGGGFWCHNGWQLFDFDSLTPIAEPLDSLIEPLGLNQLRGDGLHQLKVRNEVASRNFRACTTAQAQALIDDPSTILDFVDGDPTLHVVVRGIMVQVSNTALTVKLLRNKQWQNSWKAQQHAPEPSNLPELSKEAQYYLQHIVGCPLADLIPRLRNLAADLTHPSTRTKLGTAVHYSTMNCYGLERFFLAKLAGPALPLAVVQELGEFFRWLAEIGVLCTFHSAQISSDKPYTPGLWEGKVAVVNTYMREQMVVWNPEFTSDPQSILPAAKFQGRTEPRLTKEQFLTQLDATVRWQENWRANGSSGFSEAARFLEKSATEISHITELPDFYWKVALSGLAPKSDNDRGFHATHCKVLGLTANRINGLIKPFHAYDSYVSELLEIGWQENYMHTGPNIKAISRWWDKVDRKPWLKLSTEDVEHLRQFPIPDKVLSAMIFRPSSWLGKLPHPVDFIALMALTEVVTPGTEAAQELVEGLERFRNYRINHKLLPLGAPFKDAASYNFGYSDPLDAPRVLTEGHLDDLMNYLRLGPPITGVPQDPRMSAPETVTQAANKLTISETAACYFLQLLTLIRPTDANVKKWNGWSKKDIDAAKTELTEKQLILVAKRTGAGRSAFLAGKWLTKTTIGPATEEWKTPHYLYWQSPESRPIIPGSPPLKPYPLLFNQVWARYADGDRPG